MGPLPVWPSVFWYGLNFCWIIMTEIALVRYGLNFWWVTMLESVIVSLCLVRIFLLTQVRPCQVQQTQSPLVQPTRFTNLNHESAFRLVAAGAGLASTAFSIASSVFFYSRNGGFYPNIPGMKQIVDSIGRNFVKQG